MAAGSSLRLWLVCNRDVYLPETKCLTGEAWRICTLLCMWACDSAQACCTPTPVASTLILTCPNLSPVLTHHPHAAVTSTASKVTFPAMDPLYADPLNTVNVTVLDRPNARAAGGWLPVACCCRVSPGPAAARVTVCSTAIDAACPCALRAGATQYSVGLPLDYNSI